MFDCFGVLITDALQGICDEIRIQNEPAADQIRDLIGLSNKGLIDPRDSSKRVAEILGVTEAEYRNRIQNGEVRNYQLLAYVTELKRVYKTAILSNIGKGSLLKRFNSEELVEYFDTVVASGDIGYAKPEAEAYEITADRLGVRLDECIFTDDRDVFCEAARRVGMNAILYKNFADFKSQLEPILADSK